jgi:hypothetical protein
MSQILKIKRSSTTAVPSSLENGELAYSSNSNKLFIGRPGGTTGDVDVVGGKLFTDMLDHTAGTLTASSALIVDANSKIDVFNVDNLNFDGNSIISTNTNGNISITPNGTGSIVLDGQNWPQTDGSADQYLKTNGSGQLSWATISAGSTFTISDGTNTDTFNSGGTLVFAAGSGISTTVTNDTVTFAYSGNVPAIYDSAGAPTLAAGITAGEVRTLIEVDAAGTDNSTNVTLAGAYDYITISGQVITRNQIDLATDVTGSLPNGNLANSSVTIGSTNISLGATSTTLAGLAGVTVDNITLGIDGVGEISTTAGNLTIDSAGGTVTVDDNLTVTGNLTVQGTVTAISTNEVSIGDNIIVLNSDETGTPSQNAGIEVERGTSANVVFRWNEVTDKWEVTRDGTNYYVLIDVNNFETEITTLDGGSF